MHLVHLLVHPLTQHHLHELLYVHDHLCYQKLHWKWENVGKHVNRIFEGKICERSKFTFPFSNMTEIFFSVIQSLVSCFQALIWKGDPRNIFFGQSSFALLAQQGEQTNK